MFFFNDTATTEIYTLSLHDALPISRSASLNTVSLLPSAEKLVEEHGHQEQDAEHEDLPGARHPGQHQTVAQGGDDQDPEIGRAHRLNSSHANISYAVFCLKKKPPLRSGCCWLLWPGRGLSWRAY